MRLHSFYALLLCALWLVPAPVRAYCLYKVTAPKSPYVSWTSVPVTYRISSNLTDAKILAAIDKAFSTWGSVTCSKLKFTKGTSFSICTDKACAAFSKPGKYIDIYWFTTSSDLFANSSNPKMPFASYAYLTHDNAGGIAGASVGVNAADYKWNTTGGDTQTFDVQNELTNFIGGVIGLSDTQIAGTTMYYKLAFGDTSKQTLEQDDKNGLLYLYNTKATGCPTPPAPGANGCTAGSVVPDSGVPKADGKPVGKDGGGDGNQGGDATIGAEGAVGVEAGSGVDQGQVDQGGSGRQCTKTVDCASDEVCTVEGFCLKISGSDEGCTCRVHPPAARASRLPWPMLLLIAVLVGLARRRRP